ncbi:MAG: DUF1207 domain-containing protein [Elusimicrobia bacterium]|nr:DUF1207 domain-containing protein [Elusimicrobiota bacterium]
MRKDQDGRSFSPSPLAGEGGVRGRFSAMAAGVLILGFLTPGVLAQERVPSAWFPSAQELFEPLRADLTEPQYALRYSIPVGKQGLGEVNIGDTFGVYRADLGEGWRLQFNAGGGVATRFDLSQKTNDLQIADFTGNVPLDLKYGQQWGFRVMYWHTSSHLGDDYIKRTSPPLAKNVTDEFRWYLNFTPTTHWRFYAGTGYAFKLLPFAAGNRFQTGAEWTSPVMAKNSVQYFVWSDLQSLERTDWNASLNTRAGVKLGDPHGKGSLSLFLEFFSGHIPYLGFSHQKETHWGVGFVFDLG